MLANIGLEIHVELKTESKMFCSCAAAFGMPSGSQCCPVCMGLPGAMPILNGKAVQLGIAAGLALHGNIQPYSSFDRKQYFYPDMPKGYQITQHYSPFCLGGFLTLPGFGKKIHIIEMHLEEDSGKLIHKDNVTKVDLNRCGIPLLEIVTAPEIENGEEAYQFLNLLRDTLVCIGATTGKMQEGALRVDVNVSVRPDQASSHGQRVEMKNISSFRAVRAAIDYETARQKMIICNGETVSGETRRWDEKKNQSYPLREKVDVDYRYFPEVDLPPIHISQEMIENIKSNLPPLPEQHMLRLIALEGMSIKHAAALAVHPKLLVCFDAAYAAAGDEKKILNWLLGDYRAIAKKLSLDPDDPPFTADQFAEMMKWAIAENIKYQQIKDRLIEMCQ